jgi:ATP-binding cassette, subfamily F, member 3
MSLLTAENLQLAFGSKPILEGAAFMISAGDRVGVIGPNGTGKSTLFRIIAGQQELDGGRLHFARGVTLGYLPQDVLEVGTAPLLRSVLAAVPGKGGLERRLNDAETQLSETNDPDEQMELAQRIADLHDQIERFESEYSEHEAERILSGLGFKTSDFTRPMSEFSGGWKMRAALSGLLFKRPDLLVLDEPTNHLDIPSVNWLSDFLLAWKSSVMLISHDSEFMNRQVGRILSFEVEGLRSYTGDYDAYRRLRDQELEVRRAARRNQGQEIKQAELFIRRFRATASKARQVQSRIKQLEKMDRVQVDHARKTLDFSFPPTERIGRIAIKMRGIVQRFGDLKLYEGLEANIDRGDRIALIGSNGSGKTTLLRIMSGELEPTSGQAEHGTNVELSYYAQHRLDKLDRSRTVLEEVWRLNPSMGQTMVRSICGAFLFSGDDVEKSISVLSGGELARVSLAQLLVRPGNVLLMDEPTNHLDLISTEALAETLETYDGTLVFVSHNQAFINRIANKIWDLEDGVLTEYPGNLADYRYHLKQKAKQLAEQEAAVKTEAPKAKKSVSVERGDNKALHERRKKFNRRRVKLDREINEQEKRAAEIADRIEVLEAEQAQREGELAKPETYDNTENYNRLLADYQLSREKLEELNGRWEFTLERAETVRKELAAISEIES